MNMDAKEKLCRAAMTLKASEFREWELGFIQGVVCGVSGVKEDFYQRLAQRVAPQSKE